MRFQNLIRSAITTLSLFVTVAAHAVPTITVAPGASPAGGYLPLSLFGIAAISGVGDDTITNINVPTFSYAGRSWSSLGVVSNGYVVVGGGTNADVQFWNQNLPSALAPANILAPFWTDLNPSAGGTMRIGTLTDGSDSWIVVDWDSVPNFSEVNKLNSFELWLGLNTDAHPGEDISFAYGGVGNGDGGLLTVGAQDMSRTVGDSYYYNGIGTIPVRGTQLRVTTQDLPISVPEPGTLGLLGLGILALTTSRRRRL